MTEHAIIQGLEGVATACVTMPSCGACGWGGGTAVSNGDNNRKQPRLQQEATETTAESNGDNNREQPIQQQGATYTTTGSNREDSRRQIVLS